MIFSYNWLQSFFKKKLPEPKKLADLLTLHFAEVEQVKKQKNDFLLDIDIRPNRAGDCFSHLGVAREIAVITDSKLQIPKFKAKEDKKIKANDFVSIEVKDKFACLRYTARVIANVKVGSSPNWIKKRLISCGLRPINNIVDIANYVMLETGQPLHAFDGEKLEDKKIIVRFAKNGEKITTLDDQNFILNDKILVIADSKKPIAIAGIKGGKDTGIDKKTKIVVLESANFNSKIIRTGSRQLNLKTDASIRFEHGIDPNLTEFAIERASYLIEKFCRGKVAKKILDIYPKKIFPKIINLDLDRVDRILGVRISKNEVKKILEKLGFKIKKQKQKNFLIEIPTQRLDVSLCEDLIEEIGRIYGYNKIPSFFPLSVLTPPHKNVDIFWENFTKDILKELGFSEVYNYSFVSENDKNVFNLENLIELENPISQDFKYLRNSLIPNLLKNIQKNQKNFKEIKIFELGKVFNKLKNQFNEEKPLERKMLTGAIAREAFYEIKGVIDVLVNKMGIGNIWYDDYQPTPEDSKISIWNQKRCAEIKINNEEIGFLGEISAKILSDFKIEKKVCVFDLDFEKLIKLATQEKEFQPLSRYPSAIRDLAVLVPQKVRVQEVLNIIEIAGGEFLVDVDLFDIYEGEQLPEGKKNLAFHLIFQAKDHTLSSKEIDQLQNKIIKALEENENWEVRK